MDEPKTGAPPAPADAEPAHPHQDLAVRDAGRDLGDAHVTEESAASAPVRPRTTHDDEGHPPAVRQREPINTGR
jgi:hypothetical protein